jgi:uncharacterized protein (DUF2235 family)
VNRWHDKEEQLHRVVFEKISPYKDLAMAHNICIFSDGTGQAGGAIPDEANTNVYRLYCAAKAKEGAAQSSYYDPGIGSPREEEASSLQDRVYRNISKATGLGISKNIQNCYQAIISRWKDGEKNFIFLFGFSRGAYTVRSLGGVLSLCGVPRVDHQGRPLGDNKAAIEEVAKEAVEHVYKYYAWPWRSEDKAAEVRSQKGESFRETYHSVAAVPHFIGVWDTVSALGVRGVSDLIPWRHQFHNVILDAKVGWARQALSIDEEREVFRPVLWDERKEKEEDQRRERIQQLWFAGDHSDIGGGHDDDGQLADVTLDWMVREATKIKSPLHVDASRLALTADLQKAALAKQHNMRERTLSGRLWIKKVRPLSEKSSTQALWYKLAHQSAKPRFLAEKVPHQKGNRPYRPLGAAEHPTVIKDWKIKW